MFKISETRYLVLARKYRPQTFDQVVGQEHVTRTMSNAIKNERVAHSILLSGPRGTGKTTIARVFAKTINCEFKLNGNPCNKCKSCHDITISNGIDVFEIDGASNNSVDQIRSLRENVRYMPINSKSKIYIIDEAHMLSGSAFNALLKTLEEPPKHVLFVLATTEYHKIPTTIISRCQHYNLRRIKTDIMHDVLVRVCAEESFTLPSESLWMISNKSEGSLRDALSLLDQVMSCCTKSASHERVSEIIGSVDRSFLHKIAKAIFLGNVLLALEQIDYIYQCGYDLKVFYGDILEHFRHLLLLKIGDTTTSLIGLAPHEIEAMRQQIKNVSISRIDQILSVASKEESYIMDTKYIKLAFEILLLKLNNIQSVLSIDTLIEHLDKLKKESTVSDIKKPCETILPPSPVDNYESGENNRTELYGNSNTKGHVKSVDLDLAWEKTNEKIYELRPAVAASLFRCYIHEISKNNFEIRATDNEYALGKVKEDFDFVKKTLKQYIGNEVVIRLGKNIDNHKDSLNQDQHKPGETYKHIKDHPLVVHATDIFEGKIEYIGSNLTNRGK